MEAGFQAVVWLGGKEGALPPSTRVKRMVRGKHATTDEICEVPRRR